MKKLLLTASFFIACFLAKAQLPNDSLEYRIRVDSAKTGDVELSLYNFNFLRNYEFFGKFQDGYTLFGTQVEPRVIYYAHPRLAISAGVHLRKDFGNDGIQKSYPLFQIKYRYRNTEIISGSLESNIHHRFIEPVFDFERKISNPVEYGTQVVVNKPSLFLDAFVNWNKMEYRDSPYQEQIFAGGTADVSLLRNSRLKVSVPVQVFAFHQGGQIDTDPAPLQTLVNTAAGFKVRLATSSFVRSWGTENYFVTYSELSPTKAAAYSSGKAVFLNASISTKLGTLISSYWNGQRYISPAGMPIYQSVSNTVEHSGYSEKSRQLLLLRYLYQRQLIPNFYLDFRVEPVFDLKAGGQFEFYHSLFFVYRQNFRLFSKR